MLACAHQIGPLVTRIKYVPIAFPHFSSVCNVATMRFLPLLHSAMSKFAQSHLHTSLFQIPCLVVLVLLFFSRLFPCLFGLFRNFWRHSFKCLHCRNYALLAAAPVCNVKICLKSSTYITISISMPGCPCTTMFFRLYCPVHLPYSKMFEDIRIIFQVSATL